MLKYRSLAIATVLLLMAGFIATVGQDRVRAQDAVALTASVVEGSCDDPGNEAGALRDLSEAEGGVLTSFSRVDIPIADFTGKGYAIVVAADGNTVACGDASGDGDDVYNSIKSTSDDGYGGIAWLHARDEQTQVSLFISQGLGGGSADNGNDNPEPPAEETPEPPAEETPKPTKTPKSDEEPTVEPSGDLTTYESPTWGYTMSYDPTIWEEKVNETNATQSGPMDVLQILSGSSSVLLYSNSTDQANFDVTNVPAILAERLKEAEGVTDVVLVDSGGNAREAWGQVEFKWTGSSGTVYEYTDYYVVYSIPDQQAVAIFNFEDLTESFELSTPLREDLIDSIEMP